MKTFSTFTKYLCRPAKGASLGLAVTLASVLSFTAQAALGEVSATLEPSTISLGESARLALTINGSQAARPALPSVDGLEFTPAGQSSSFQSINGAVTMNVSVTYQITPARAGTFTIPPIQLAGASSKPLVLRVLKKAPGQSGATPNTQSQSSLPPPKANWQASESGASAENENAFLRVQLPKQELYVGELAPVQVKAYFRAGLNASLNGLPVLNSDALTLNKLSARPEQTQEVIDGKTYTVLTWSSALTAVKAGDYPFNLEMPVMVRVQEPARRRSSPFGNSPFDDSFFDDVFKDFFGRTQEKPLTLRTESGLVKILSLPAAGRPADFSGAVGKFEISGEATPTKVTAGDPITVRLKVSGQGNFDRAATRGVDSSAEWKSYKVTSSFEPADSAGYEGVKTFEQAVVPLTTGQQKIPELTFSYFDPDARQYVTRATTAIPIEVAPGGAKSSVAARDTSGANPSQTLANVTAPAFAPNKTEPGRFVSSLRPIVFAPWFIALNGVVIAAFGIATILHARRKRLASDPEIARARHANQSIRASVAAMDEALKASDAAGFFDAARRTVQEHLSRAWNVPASHVTLAEINRRLNGDGEELRALFKAADEIAYSGRRFSCADLQQWRAVVTGQLQRTP